MAHAFTALEAAYPTVDDLHAAALRKIPRFVADYIDGGSGGNAVLLRNREAFDATVMLPRYGVGAVEPSLDTKHFGHRYAAPFGVAPMGLGALVRPELEMRLAKAAQAANVPYVLSTAASAGIEDIARVAPDVFWFQLFGLPCDDHRVTFDLIGRAERAGARVLVLTMDTPVQARRPKDLRHRLGAAFAPTPRTLFDMACRPGWLAGMARHGRPGCEVLRPYVPAGATASALNAFARSEIEGGFTWDLVRRIRDAWPRSLVVKGVLGREDAEAAVRAGADGVIVSNHGGRTFDAAPASLAMLPEVVDALAGRAAVLLDSGIRSGLDIARGLALGAQATFLGRPFLHAVAALGDEGGGYLIALLKTELRHSMMQLGAGNTADLRSIRVLRG